MDRSKRWRWRWPSGSVGRRRVGVTALAPLAVTVLLVMLLEVVFHLGKAAVVVAILGITATAPGCPTWRGPRCPALQSGRCVAADRAGGAGRTR